MSGIYYHCQCQIYSAPTFSFSVSSLMYLYCNYLCQIYSAQTFAFSVSSRIFLYCHFLCHMHRILAAQRIGKPYNHKTEVNSSLPFHCIKKRTFGAEARSQLGHVMPYSRLIIFSLNRPLSPCQCLKFVGKKAPGTIDNHTLFIVNNISRHSIQIQ